MNFIGCPYPTDITTNHLDLRRFYCHRDWTYGIVAYVAFRKHTSWVSIGHERVHTSRRKHTSRCQNLCVPRAKARHLPGAGTGGRCQ